MIIAGYNIQIYLDKFLIIREILTNTINCWSFDNTSIRQIIPIFGFLDNVNDYNFNTITNDDVTACVKDATYFSDKI